MKSVPQEIIGQAINCPYDYACIKDSDPEQCKKIPKGEFDLMNITPKAEIDIKNNPYLVHFPYRDAYYCVCPVYSYLN